MVNLDPTDDPGPNKEPGPDPDPNAPTDAALDHGTTAPTPPEAGPEALVDEAAAILDPEPAAVDGITEYLSALPPSEIHARCLDALDHFHTIQGYLPRNRCYDGFVRLAGQIVEIRPGAMEYGERLKWREPDPKSEEEPG